MKTHLLDEKDVHQGLVILFRTDTGEPFVIANASAVTAIRTAAVSGLATRRLSRPGSKTLALFGTGTHLNAVGASVPTSRELDAATIRDSVLVVDRRESALAESGEVLASRPDSGNGYHRVQVPGAGGRGPGRHRPRLSECPGPGTGPDDGTLGSGDRWVHLRTCQEY